MGGEGRKVETPAPSIRAYAADNSCVLCVCVTCVSVCSQFIVFRLLLSVLLEMAVHSLSSHYVLDYTYQLVYS